VVLTSATLSVSGDLEYYRERVGFIDGPEKIMNSPFDYEKHATIYTITAARFKPLAEGEQIRIPRRGENTGSAFIRNRPAGGVYIQHIAEEGCRVPFD
jgi:hypothetical protein